MKQLIARPAVRRTQREIIVPRSSKLTLRPNQGLIKQLQLVNKQRSPQKPARKLTTPVTPVHTPRIVTRAKPGRQPGISKRPTISYVSREMSPEDRKKVSSIKNIGKHKYLIIIGNGPSILETPLHELRSNPRIDMMSINRPDKRIWPTQYWLFCDTTQYTRHKELWLSYEGKIINTTAIAYTKPNSVHIRNLGGIGFSEDLTNGFYLGRSSCFAAMQVGLWMGYEHIYLFGVDMKSVVINGKTMTHYYGNNPDVTPTNRESRFVNEARHYQHAADTLSSTIRSKFTFCSAYLAFKFVDRFNRLDHRKAVERILEVVNNL